jgi:hypothetical protein
MRPRSFSFTVETDNNTTIEGITSMNFLVFLNERAGELEKILSGTKSMVLKEFNPSQFDKQRVRPGDNLYFLRKKDEYRLRVKAVVVRVSQVMNGLDEDISHTLKEMQPKLQLTEDQYNYWSVKKQILLVEFESARKIPVIQVASNKVSDLSEWIAFEEFSFITD